MDTLTAQRSTELQPYQQHELLAQLEHGQRTEANALGHLTTFAQREYHLAGRVVALHRNNDLVGWTLWSDNRWRERRIIQIWVRPDARLIEHGRALIDWLEQDGANRGQRVLRLWCATDLAANLFWSTLSFDKLGWRWGGKKSGRRHWLWRRPILAPSHPAEIRLACSLP